MSKWDFGAIFARRYNAFCLVCKSTLNYNFFFLLFCYMLYHFGTKKMYNIHMRLNIFCIMVYRWCWNLLYQFFAFIGPFKKRVFLFKILFLVILFHLKFFYYSIVRYFYLFGQFFGQLSYSRIKIKKRKIEQW